MSDVFSKEKRSQVMSRIRSRGNKKTEIALVQLMKRERITGWRRQRQVSLGVPPGGSSIGRRSTYVRPDFIFPTLKLAVFVDGCFWHSCPIHATSPAANAEFWARKLAGNQQRDRLVTRLLKRKGWVVVRFWEHDLPSTKVVSRLRRAIVRCEELRTED